MIELLKIFFNSWGSIISSGVNDVLLASPAGQVIKYVNGWVIGVFLFTLMVWIIFFLISVTQCPVNTLKWLWFDIKMTSEFLLPSWDKDLWIMIIIGILLLIINPILLGATIGSMSLLLTMNNMPVPLPWHDRY